MKYISFFITFLFSISLLAGFHLEPSLGYSLDSSWDRGTASGSNSQVNLGSRFGYQYEMGLHLGVEAQYGWGRYKNLSITNTDLDAKTLTVGAYVGYQSSLGFRGSLGVTVLSSVNLNDPSNTTPIGYGPGTGFKLSGGYLVTEWLAVNLEYHTYKYDDSFHNPVEFYVGDGLAGSGGDLKTDFIVLSVSFPFDLVR